MLEETAEITAEEDSASWLAGPGGEAISNTVGLLAAAGFAWLTYSPGYSTSRIGSTAVDSGNWVAEEQADAAAEARARAQAELGGGTAVTELPSDDSWGSPWEGSAEDGADSVGTIVTTTYVEPPPPPPPPQNCYRAGTCRPTAASNALLHHKLITDQVTNNEKWPTICKDGRCVTEKLDSKQGLVNGTQLDPSTKVALQDLADGSCSPDGQSWVYYHQLGPNQRAQGVDACLTYGTYTYTMNNGKLADGPAYDKNSMIKGTPSSTSGIPSCGDPDARAAGLGWPDCWPSGYERGHLLANLLGGSGSDRRNLVPLRAAANGYMRVFEKSISDQLRVPGTTVFYAAEPVYGSNKYTPKAVDITAVVMHAGVAPEVETCNVPNKSNISIPYCLWGGLRERRRWLMSWVDRLQEITGWQGEEAWGGDWSETETALGVAIPSDYKELCERFGPGYFTDYIRIIHDRGEEGMLSQWQSDLRLCRHGGLSSIWDPYHIFGCTERRGLITWSHNDWGVYHWLADANINPDEWPTLVVGELGLPDGSGYRYDMPASEVIYRVLADSEFEPFTISGKGVRPWFYRFDPDTAEDPEVEE